MRTAPPVQVALPSCAGWRTAGALLAAAAAASVALWATATRAPAAVWPLALLAAALAAAWAWRSLASPGGALQWDGSRWQLQRELAGACVRPELAIDLGEWMLLRLVPQAEGAVATPTRRAEWVALSARRCGAAWHGLRVALLALPPKAAPAAAQP